ncbi:hypothetical protein ME783_11760 [Lactobacillus delbrueckii]|nr:hypothetical protein ME783_11760 [Lactobacillus delbrueckii]
MGCKIKLGEKKSEALQLKYLALFICFCLEVTYCYLRVSKISFDLRNTKSCYNRDRKRNTKSKGEIYHAKRWI